MVDLGGGGEQIEIEVENIERMVDLFFVRKVTPTKKHKQTKNRPGVENQ